MADTQSVWRRVQEYRASLGVVFWACAASVVAMLVVGFGIAGWVTGGTAKEMASEAGLKARTELAAQICVYRFQKSPDAAAKLAALKKSGYWDRDDFIEKGGWVTLAGMKEPIEGAADLCAERLIETKLPPLKESKTSG